MSPIMTIFHNISGRVCWLNYPPTCSEHLLRFFIFTKIMLVSPSQQGSLCCVWLSVVLWINANVDFIMTAACHNMSIIELYLMSRTVRVLTVWSNSEVQSLLSFSYPLYTYRVQDKKFTTRNVQIWYREGKWLI